MYNITDNEDFTLTSISNQVTSSKCGKIDITLRSTDHTKITLTLDVIILDNCNKTNFIISLNRLLKTGDIETIYLGKTQKYLIIDTKQVDLHTTNNINYVTFTPQMTDQIYSVTEQNLTHARVGHINEQY